MSEQPPSAGQPPSFGPGQDRPGQGWAPAPLAGGERATFANRAASDPAAAGPDHRVDAIDSFAPRRSFVPVLAAVVTVAVALAIFYTTNRPQPLPSPTPSASHSATPKSTPRPGKQFTADRSRATGTWQITNSRWSSGGLDVYIEITLDTGALTPSFDAMPNSGAGYVPGEASTLTPGFPDASIRPGTTRGGWLFFGTSRETTLIFLGDANDPQISGIEVPG
jgi:hypothetical protein